MFVDPASSTFANAVDIQQITRLTVPGMSQFLLSRGLPSEVVHALAAHHVDGAVLVRLTERDLDQIGVKSVGARMRLQDIIQAANTSSNNNNYYNNHMRSAPVAAPTNNNNTVYPPWVQAQQHHPGSSSSSTSAYAATPIRIHNDSQRQDNNNKQQQHVAHDHEMNTHQVLGTLSAVFRSLSDANFVRLSAPEQLARIKDARRVLDETERYLETLPAAEAAQYRDAVGNFKQLVALLLQRLQALEAGRAQQREQATETRQQQQQQQQRTNRSNNRNIQSPTAAADDDDDENDNGDDADVPLDHASAAEALSRLESATVYVASAEFRKLPTDTRTVVLDQTSRVYDYLVSYCVENPDRQAPIVPRLLRIQSVLSEAAEHLAGGVPSSSSAAAATVTATAGAANSKSNKSNARGRGALPASPASNTAATVHATRAASSAPAAAAAAAAAANNNNNNKVARGSLADMFGFFNSSEFAALPNGEKLRMIDVAESRLIQVMRAAQQLSQAERATLAPTVEKLSGMLSQMRRHFTTTATTTTSNNNNNNNARAAAAPTSPTKKRSLHHPLRRQTREDQEREEEDEEEEEEENEEEEEQDDDNNNKSAYDEENESEEKYAQYNDQGGNIRAALVLLRDMLQTLTSSEFRRLPVKDRIHDVQVAQKLHMDIVDLLDECEPAVQRAFETIVRQLGESVEEVKANLIQEIQASQPTAQIQKQQQSAASEATGQRPRAPPRRQQQQQQQQHRGPREAETEEQQQQPVVATKDREDLKQLFTTFKFMAGGSFDELPQEQKIALLQRAKQQLEQQLARVERSASAAEREQLSPILQQFVDILINVNQLVAEQARVALEEQKMKSISKQQHEQQKAQEQRAEPAKPLGSDLQSTLQQISTVFSIISSDEFPSMAAEQQQRIALAGQRLIAIATTQLETAAPEEKAAFGPVLQRMAVALSSTEKANEKQAAAKNASSSASSAATAAANNSSSNDGGGGKTTVDLSQPMELLVAAFKMLVSEHFSSLSDEEKMGIVKRAQELLILNLQMLPRASAEDKRRYAAPLQQVGAAFKKIGIVKGDAIDKLLAAATATGSSTVASAPAATAAPTNSSSGSDHTAVLDELMGSMHELTDPTFAERSTSQRAQILASARRRLVAVKSMMAENAFPKSVCDRIMPLVSKYQEMVDLITRASDSIAAQQQLAEKEEEEVAANNSNNNSGGVSPSDILNHLVSNMQQLTDPNFTRLSTGERAKLLSGARSTLAAITGMVQKGAFPAEAAERISPLVTKFAELISMISRMDSAIADAQEKSNNNNTNNKQEQQTKNNNNGGGLSNSSNSNASAARTDFHRLTTLFSSLTKNPTEFARMTQAQKADVVNMGVRLVDDCVAHMQGAPQEETRRMMPVLSQMKDFFAELDNNLKQLAATSAGGKDNNNKANSAANDNNNNEDEDEEEDEAAGNRGEQEEFRAMVESDFNRLSKLFQQVTENMAEFQAAEAEQRHQVVATALHLVARCMRHLEKTAASAAEQAEMMEMLTGMKAFFEKLEKSMQRVDAARANEARTQAAVDVKQREVAAARASSTASASTTTTAGAGATTGKPSVDVLSQLASSMQQLTSAEFLQLPHIERKEMLETARERLVAIQRMMTSGGFPAQAVGRIAPLVDKFKELIGAVSQADEALLSVQQQQEKAEASVAAARKNLNNNQQQQQQQQQESKSSAAVASIASPDGTVTVDVALQRLMEVYQTIVKPSFLQQTDLQAQRATINTVRTLAQIVAKGIATEKNVPLRQKVFAFLSQVGDIVEAVERHMGTARTVPSTSTTTTTSSAKTTESGSSPRTDENNNKNTQQQEEADDEEDEEGDDAPPKGCDNKGESEDEDEDIDVDVEQELAGQLDALLNIIRAPTTIGAVKEGGAKRQRVVTLIGTAVEQCQRQINIIGTSRGDQYQPILNQIKQAFANISSINAPVSSNNNNSSSSSAANGNNSDDKKQLSSMERARDISGTLGTVLESLNSDRLLAMSNEQRMATLTRIAGVVSNLHRRTEELGDEEKQALLPTLQQIIEFIRSMANVTSQAAAAGLQAGDVSAAVVASNNNKNKNTDSKKSAQQQQQQKQEKEKENANDEEDEEGDDEDDDGASSPVLEDSALRDRLLAQLQRVDEVISSPGFQKAPLDMKRATAQTILQQMTELRRAAQRLLSPKEVDSFERDAADIIARLTDMLSGENKKSDNNNGNNNNKTSSQEEDRDDNDDGTDEDDEEDNEEEGDEQQPSATNKTGNSGSSKNGGRPPGRPALDEMSAAGKQVLGKVQQLFSVLNSPAFSAATDAAREKIAAEILRQAKIILGVTDRLPEAERVEIRPIVVGIVRMTRAVADPNGQERDEETSEEEEPTTSTAASTAANRAAAAAKSSSSASAAAKNDNNNKSKSSNDASTDSADIDAQLQSDEKTNVAMHELLTIAKLLQSGGDISKEDIANIAERIERILRNDLTMWREVPELKSLVRFITALLSRRTENLQTSFSGEFKDDAEEEGEGDEGEEAEEDDEEAEEEAEEGGDADAAPRMMQPGRSPLEARLFQVTQQLIASADKIDSEEKLAPFVRVLDAIGPHREGLNATESQLFQVLFQQVQQIMRGFSNDNDNNSSSTKAAASPPAATNTSPAKTDNNSNGKSKSVSPAAAAAAAAVSASSPVQQEKSNDMEEKNNSNGNGNDRKKGNGSSSSSSSPQQAKAQASPSPAAAAAGSTSKSRRRGESGNASPTGARASVQSTATATHTP